MNTKNKILAICGSTRKLSSNLSLVKALADLSKDQFEFSIFTGLKEIPQFDPDDDVTPAPSVIESFRKMIKDSDAVIICTPEYAMGVPGSLKNAIDWTVSSGEFMHKPTALITASSQGQKGHAALLETLKIIECEIPESIQLLIPFIKTKINAEGKIIHAQTQEELKALLKALGILLNK
jgi:chromate reductase